MRRYLELHESPKFASIVFCLTVGCAQDSQSLPRAIDASREWAVANRDTLTRLAETLQDSGIEWTNGKEVRYKNLAQEATAGGTNTRSAAIGFDIAANAINTTESKAIFVGTYGVDFVRYASGIVPAGTAVGWLVGDTIPPQCVVVQRVVDLSLRYQCERVSGRIILYVSRS